MNNRDILLLINPILHTFFFSHSNRISLQPLFPFGGDTLLGLDHYGKTDVISLIILSSSFIARRSLSYAKKGYPLFSRRSYKPTPMDTRILKADPSSITFDETSGSVKINDAETLESLSTAAEILKRRSSPVAFPTETVYGLGADCTSSEAVKQIYEVKNRPADNPLISHVSSLAQLKSKLLGPDSRIPEIYTPLIEKFWPGPLTILLPVENGCKVSPICTFGQPTFAVRMPSHPVARALIALSETPLAAPSANLSTRPSPTSAQHVYHDINGKIEVIVDGGSCEVGVESTVVDGLSDPPVVLRPGGITVEMIKNAGGERWRNVIYGKNVALEVKENEIARTPGMKYRHYSPTAQTVLFVDCGDGSKAVSRYIEENSLANKRIALLPSISFDVSKIDLPGNSIIRSLGTTKAAVSHNLFSLLREVDEQGVDVILVEGVDDHDEGLAIMNRLKKASCETIVGRK